MERKRSVWLIVGQWFSDSPGTLAALGVGVLLFSYWFWKSSPDYAGPWLVALIGAISVALGVSGYGYRYDARRRDERERWGCCLRCGYSLTGNVSGVCPECGTPAAR